MIASTLLPDAPFEDPPPPPPLPPTPIPTVGPLVEAPWPPLAALGLVAALMALVLASPLLTRALNALSPFVRGLPPAGKPFAAIALLAILPVLVALPYLPIAVAVPLRSRPPGVTLAASLGLRRFRFLEATGLAVAYLVAYLVWASVVARMFRLLHVPPPPVLTPLIERYLHNPAVLTILFVIVCMLAPVFEEIAFRGVLYASLAERYGEAVALITSAVLFALIHLDWRRMVVVIAAGVFNALIFKKTRSLWPAILLHATVNTLGFLLTLLVVSRGLG